MPNTNFAIKGEVLQTFPDEQLFVVPKVGGFNSVDLNFLNMAAPIDGSAVDTTTVDTPAPDTSTGGAAPVTATATDTTAPATDNTSTGGSGSSTTITEPTGTTTTSTTTTTTSTPVPPYTQPTKTLPTISTDLPEVALGSPVGTGTNKSGAVAQTTKQEDTLPVITVVPVTTTLESAPRFGSPMGGGGGGAKQEQAAKGGASNWILWAVGIGIVFLALKKRK